MVKIVQGILGINKDAKVNVTGKDIDTCVIEFIEGTEEISKADIKTEMDRLQAEYDAQDYARKREGEYPSTKDFMEAYTEKEIGGNNGKWDAYVINYNKVRTENPK